MLTCQTSQNRSETPLRCVIIMLKIIFIFTFPFFFLFLSLLSSTKVLAQEDLPECPLTITTDPSSTPYDHGNQRITAEAGKLNSITFSFDMNNVNSVGNQYDFGGYLYINHSGPWTCESLYPKITDSQMIQGTKLYVNKDNIKQILSSGISYKFTRDFNIIGCGNYFLNPNQTITLTVEYYVGEAGYKICKPVQYTISLPFRECTITPDGGGNPFNLDNENKKIKINDIIYDGLHKCVQVEITDPNGRKKVVSKIISSDGESFEIPMKRADYSIAGNYTVDVYLGESFYYGYCQNIQTRTLCTAPVEIAPVGATPRPSPTPTPTPTLSPECLACREPLPGYDYQMKCNEDDCNKCWGCPGYIASAPVPLPSLAPICDQLSGDRNDQNTNRGKCYNCMETESKKERKPHVWTAFGCMPADFSEIIGKFIFTTGIGIAGGISFLYFLYGCFLIITSSGNPEKIEEAKQIIVSALSGLLLIIFSVFILEVVGVGILRLPGFEATNKSASTAPPAPPPGIQPTSTPPPCATGTCTNSCQGTNTGQRCNWNTSMGTQYGYCCIPGPTSTPTPTPTITPTPTVTLTPTPTVIPNTCAEYLNSTNQPCPIFSTKTSLDGKSILTFRQQCGNDNRCKYFCYGDKENPQLDSCYTGQTLDNSFLNKCRNDINNPNTTVPCPASYSGECENKESCTFYRECGYQNDIYTDTNGWCQYFCYSQTTGKHIRCWPGQF